MASAVKKLAALTPAPISLASLHKFSTSVPTAIPASTAAIQSSRFLSEQMAIRAAKRCVMLEQSRFEFPAIKRLSDRYETLCQPTKTESEDEGKAFEAAVAFGKWFNTNLVSLEQDVSYLQEQLKEAIESQESHKTSLQDRTNTLMESVHNHLITTRLFLKQHDLLLAAAGHVKAADGSNFPADGPISIGSVGVDIHQLVEDTAEDCRAFCIEKNGEAPDVKVISGPDLPPREPDGSISQAKTPYCLIVEGHLHFILMEIFKNSMGAMLAHWGRDLIDAPPLEVRLSGRGKELGIRISDMGGGIGIQHRRTATDFFQTTAVPMKATYGYSKAHGASFSGLGVGLPMARIYSRLSGGDLSFNVLPGHGTDTFIIVNRSADFPFPV